MPLTRILCCAIVTLSLLSLSGCSRTGEETEGATGTTQTLTRSAPQVFLLRGGGGGVFSRGMDDIGEKLAAEGIENTVIGHQEWSEALDTITDATQSRRNRPPVILIGHSLGANRAVDVATALQGRRVRVDFLVTFAATKQNVIPRNVRRTTNYYFSQDGWGEASKAGLGFRGRLNNVDVSVREGVHHFNVEKTERYQVQVIDNIKRIIARR